MSALCTLPGCTRPILVKEKGWCEAHYRRWRRHGDPLGGQKPRGEIARFFHDIVMQYDGDECLSWPFAKVGRGYGYAPFEGRHQLVHRRVCEEVNGPPPTPDHHAAHSCGNGHLACVTKRHLSWKTRKENKEDELLHGTRARGERSGRAKLAEADVREIRALRGVLSQRELADQFAVSQSTVGMIQRGVNWGWLEAGAS